MKNFLQSSLIIFSFVFIAACSSEDPEPPAGSGTWKLESFVLADFPAGYTSNENSPYAVNEITFGGLTYTSYSMDLNSDNSYERVVGVEGAPSIIDDGLWEIEEDNLTLSNKEDDDEFSYEFSIEIQEEKRLWISERVTFGGWVHDDTLAAWNSRFTSQAELTEYLNSLTDEEYNQLFAALEIDLIYAFIKE